MSPVNRTVLCGPDSQSMEIADRREPFFWTYSQFTANGEPVRLQEAGVWADILVENLRQAKLPTETPEPHELAFEPGRYGLDTIIVLRPAHLQNEEAGRKRFDVLVAVTADGSWPGVQLRANLLTRSYR